MRIFKALLSGQLDFEGGTQGGARGVMVIIVRNEHVEPRSNPELGYVHFTSR